MSSPKQLAQAVVEGTVADVKRLAKQAPDAVAHWKPIMDAAYYGRAKAAKALIAAGADPNVLQGTADRHRPLTRCLEHKKTFPRGPEHVETASVLVAAGADIEAPGGRHGFTPLAHAAFGGDPTLIELMLDAGCRVDGFAAAMLLDKRRLKAALKRDAGLPNARDAVGRTPLHWLGASGVFQHVKDGEKKCVEIAELLLDAGADVNASYDIAEGNDEVFAATPLWWATGWKRNVALVRLLLARGARAESSIFSASFEGCMQVLACYAEAGVDVDTEFHGRTPLLDLLYWRKPGAVPWLLEQGADPNRKDKDGRTALHLAALTGARDEIVAALLDHGAKIDAKDEAGKTPLALAKSKQKKKVVALLQQRGAKA